MRASSPKAKTMGSKNWVTLTDYPSPELAHLAKTALADAGIASEVAGEHTARNLSYIGGLVSVRLLVQEEDIAAAREALAITAELPQDDSPDLGPPIKVRTEADKLAKHCLLIGMLTGFIPVVGPLALTWIFARFFQAPDRVTRSGAVSLGFATLLAAGSVALHVALIRR